MKRFTFRGAQAWCILVVLMIAFPANWVLAQDDAPISSNQKIRFYKVNKDLQGDRIMLGKKKTSQAGCHNFIKQVRVHRAVQTGFVACSLYEAKDCPVTKVVPVAREKDPRRTYLLTEGFGWLPESEEERGVKVKSWRCDMELEADLLGSDSELAKKEVGRLRLRASRAKEILAKAKKQADRTKKESEEAIESAAAALKRAIDAGYEPPVILSGLIGEEDENSDEDSEEDSTKKERSEGAKKESD